MRAIPRALQVSRAAVREVLRRGSAEVPHLARPEKALEHRDDILRLLRECAGSFMRAHEELTTICHYACLRRQSSKAASVFILRFFHGYALAGIARVLRRSPGAVDTLLSVARREVRARMDDPSPGESLGRPDASIPRILGIAQPDAFVAEVQRAIFERFASLAIHGSRAGDMPLIFDGMRYNNMNGSGGGGLTVFMINTGNVEEMSVQTGGGGAENQVSGVFVNVIPKSGGNSFQGISSSAAWRPYNILRVTFSGYAALTRLYVSATPRRATSSRE